MLNILRELAGRHITLDGGRCGSLSHSWLWNKIALCLFDDCAVLRNYLFLGSLCRLSFSFHFSHLAMGDAHHCFIEAVDGRIVLPVQRAVKLQFLFRERTEFLYLLIGNLNFGSRLGLIYLSL